MVHGRPRGRAAGHQPAAALEAEQRGVEAFAADMLEHDVDALLLGDLADDAFEALGLVIDDVIGPERLGFLGLGVVADGGDHGAAERLGHLDGDRADAGAGGVHENGFAGLELGIVEQHVLGGAEGDRRAGRVAQRHAGRHRHDEPGGQVDQVAGKAVEMEAHDAGDVLAEIVAAFLAGGAVAAGHRAIHDDLVAGLEVLDARADRGDLGRGFGADDQRQLALGEGHAAKAPDVEMVQRDRLDADLHFALGGRRRIGHLDEFELAVADELELAHGSSYVLDVRRYLNRGLKTHHQRHVLSAEAERIRQGVRHARVAGLVRHDVEHDRRVGNVVVDGGRNALVLAASAARTRPRPRRRPTACGRSSTCWTRSARS